MDGADAAQIWSERVRDTYGRAKTPIYLGSLIMTLLALQTASVIWSNRFIVAGLYWVLTIALVQAVVTLYIHRFHATCPVDGDLRSWAHLRVVLEATHGLSWSCILLSMYPAGGQVGLLCSLTALTGVAAAISPSYAIYLPTAVAFLSASLLPGALFLFRQAGDLLALYGAIGLVGTYILTVLNAVRWSAIYEEAIATRLALSAGMEERKRLMHVAQEGRQMAEAAVEERTRFFGAASHDLRQPVHALGLYSALLTADPPAHTRKKLIEGIAACADNLERLLTSILTVARPIGLVSEGKPAPVRLDEVILRVVTQFRADAELRGLTLKARPSGCWVVGEETSIDRILANLVSNAIRYTTDGGVAIRARQRGSWVRVLVADTGIGLADADKQRIFDPFVRLPREQQDAHGVGLGLSTVRELCRSHGYRCKVRSVIGRGSVFELWLPHTPPPPPAVQLSNASSLPENLRVLLVDDDESVVNATTLLMEAWEIPIATCRSGSEALAVLAASPSAKWHILLDYRLGNGENGLDVVDKVRQLYGQVIKITLMTGEDNLADLYGKLSPDISLLRKPLRPVRIRALLSSRF